MNPLPPWRPARSTRSRVWGVLVLLALLLGACTNPFKPADPEPPDSNQVPEKWGSPEEVLETVARALASRSTNGATAYLHAFSDSTVPGDKAYRSFYDGGVKTGWEHTTQQTAPEPWDIQQELNVHNTISGIRSTFDYFWQWGFDDTGSPLDDDPALSDTVVFHRKYTLLAVPKAGTPEIIAIGYVDMAFEKQGGRWSIYRWVDRVDPAVGVNPAATDQRTMSWWRLESLTR